MFFALSLCLHPVHRPSFESNEGVESGGRTCWQVAVEVEQHFRRFSTGDKKQRLSFSRRCELAITLDCLAPVGLCFGVNSSIDVLRIFLRISSFVSYPFILLTAARIFDSSRFSRGRVLTLTVPRLNAPGTRICASSMPFRNWKYVSCNFSVCSPSVSYLLHQIQLWCTFKRFALRVPSHRMYTEIEQRAPNYLSWFSIYIDSNLHRSYWKTLHDLKGTWQFVFEMFTKIFESIETNTSK